jgi:uncharacterized membrane protein
MSATPYATSRGFSRQKHHIATVAALIVAFWAVAALLVIAVHQNIESPHAAVALQLAAIIVAGFAYMALTAREATVDHALFVGTLWLLFAIIAEIIASAHLGREWFELLGAPNKPLYRCMLMFAWVAAPALFARNQS